MPNDAFWRWYDRGARADFGGTLLSFVFDWKGWIATTVGGSGGAIAFLKAAIDGRSPLDVWIFALLVVAALVTIVYLSISILEKKSKTVAPQAAASAPNEFANDVPDIKIADDYAAWRLFETPKERDKLIPLLEAGKLIAWGRLGKGIRPQPKYRPTNGQPIISIVALRTLRVALIRHIFDQGHDNTRAHITMCT
jgi:hypothetical protein